MTETNHIIDFFCDKRGVACELLFSDRLLITVSTTRYMIWYYLHYRKGYSASRLSRIFNRSRASIFRGMRIFKREIKYYKQTKTEYDSIVIQLEGAL